MHVRKVAIQEEGAGVDRTLVRRARRLRLRLWLCLLAADMAAGLYLLLVAGFVRTVRREHIRQSALAAVRL